MTFPVHRGRRLRRTPGLRALAQETRITPEQLVAPLFVIDRERQKQPTPSLPRHARLSADQAAEEAASLHALGVGSVLLFGIPSHKDAEGTAGYDENGVVPKVIRAIKRRVPEMVVWADVCLCEYTDHGHCGLIRNGEVDNDATLPLLARAAQAYARAGADLVAPSDMMDGRVAAIREGLDGGGYSHIPILAYSAKSASAFYGPFREAADSAPKFGDRRGYQMDAANRREALREIALDLEEGADAVMVKPALAYLDVIRDARERFDAPIAAYNVSGEYAMVKAAAANGWIDERRIVLEILTGIVRAGADFILTYHALDAAKWLKEE